MTKLQSAFIKAFKESYAKCREVVGEDDFVFKMDIMIATRPNKEEASKILRSIFQEVLDIANTAAKPKTVEGTTVQ